MASQNSGSGVDNHVIFDGGVPFLAPELFSGTPGHRQGPECYPLIDPYPISYEGGFAYHDTGSMIDKETLPNSCSRMDVDARFAMGILGHKARHKRDGLGKNLGGQAVHGDSKKTRIAEDNFIIALSCRIPFHGSMNIFRKHRGKLWHCF